MPAHSDLRDFALNRRAILAGLAGSGLAMAGFGTRWQRTGAAQSLPMPPVADARLETRTFSSHDLTDPYAWLENPEDPEVIAYLEAENAYTDAILAQVGELRETLASEMEQRVVRDVSYPPYRMGPYLYYVRTEEGKDYDIYCRRLDAPDAPEQILLDLNTIDAPVVIAGYMAPSYDHELLAYALDTEGSDAYQLAILNMETGETLPDTLSSDGYAFEWAADNRTLFYAPFDDNLRTNQLFRHVLGSDPANDQLVFQEDDELFWIWLTMSDDKQFVVLASDSFTSSEMRYLPANTPEGEFTLFTPRRDGVQYYLNHAGDEFLVLTNEDVPNFELLAVPEEPTQREKARVLLAGDDRTLYLNVRAFQNRLLVYGRQDGLNQLWICDAAAGQAMQVETPEQVRNVWIAENREYASDSATIGYASPVTPNTWFDLNLLSGEKTLILQEEAPGHDPAGYVSERLMASAPDGTLVPISLVRRRDMPAGPTPVLLNGYGAYGYSNDPWFAADDISLLDRGVALAYAHVRGGQEMGRYWWEDGKLLHKRNTFTDYIACAEALIEQGFTTPQQLVASGGSAGGMLMGAVANERPDLFQTIVATVPFVDVLRAMLDPDLPLTTSEFVEWGDPSVEPFGAYIAGYSPYDNVTAQAYPNFFIAGSLEDERVQYWQPAKWAAKLRAMKDDDHLLLLRTTMDAGHLGPSAFGESRQQVAESYAFVLMTLGLADDDGATMAAPGASAPVAARRYVGVA